MMRIPRSALGLFLACSLAFACSSDSRGGDEEDSATRILRGRSLTSSDSLALIAGVVARGPHLLVLDVLADPALHVIDREDGRYLAGYGRKGEGPGEFRGPWAVGLDSEGAIWVSDPGLSRITRVGLREGEDERLELTTEEIVTIESPSTAYAVTPLGSGGFIGLGAFDGGQVGIFDSSGKFLRSMAPASGFEDMPVTLRLTSTMSELALLRGDYVAIAARNAGQITIVNIERDTTIQASVPVPFQPQIEISPNGTMLLTPETRYAYGDIVGNAKVIFALFSGKTEGEGTREVPGGDAWLGDQVHVFDWRGNLLDVFRLDSGASGLAVEGDSLYTTVLSPVPGIRAYAMDQHLRDIMNSQ